MKTEVAEAVAEVAVEAVGMEEVVEAVVDPRQDFPEAAESHSLRRVRQRSRQKLELSTSGISSKIAPFESVCIYRQPRLWIKSQGQRLL